MADHQMPLFDRYPIEVEFARHRWYQRQGLDDAASTKLSPEEIGARSGHYAAIEPIELAHASARLTSVEHAWELATFYYGDTELWHLYPGEAHHIGVLGEVFRSELILRSVAKTEEAARLEFDRRLEEIEAILAQQRVLVERFNDSVADYVAQEIRNIRAYRRTFLH